MGGLTVSLRLFIAMKRIILPKPDELHLLCGDPPSILCALWKPELMTFVLDNELTISCLQLLSCEVKHE